MNNKNTAQKLQTIMANIDNVNVNNTKKMIKPISFSKDSPYYKPKNPDQKDYLVYYYAYDDNGEEYKSFELITGRKNLYDFLKSIIEYINLDESRVLVEGVALENSVSVYDFLVYAKSFYSEEDGFDIDEYLNNRSTEDDGTDDDYINKNNTQNYLNGMSISNNTDEAYQLYLKTINDLNNEPSDSSPDDADDTDGDSDIFV